MQLILTLQEHFSCRIESAMVSDLPRSMYTSEGWEVKWRVNEIVGEFLKHLVLELLYSNLLIIYDDLDVMSLT